jgi:hypothetical protein
VVIADGLEKLTYLREEDRVKVEAATETVFVTHAAWLRLPVHVIYTFPFWLRFSASTLGALYHREPRLLPIAGSHALPKGDGARLASFNRLFDRQLVLTYLTGEEWYDIHPLVRRAPEVRARLDAPA